MAPALRKDVTGTQRRAQSRSRCERAVDAGNAPWGLREAIAPARRTQFRRGRRAGDADEGRDPRLLPQRFCVVALDPCGAPYRFAVPCRASPSWAAHPWRGYSADIRPTRTSRPRPSALPARRRHARGIDLGAMKRAGHARELRHGCSGVLRARSDQVLTPAKWRIRSCHTPLLRRLRTVQLAFSATVMCIPRDVRELLPEQDPHCPGCGRSRGALAIGVPSAALLSMRRRRGRDIRSSV